MFVFWNTCSFCFKCPISVTPFTSQKILMLQLKVNIIERLKTDESALNLATDKVYN